MQVIRTGQSNQRHADAPIVREPVLTTLDVHTYYVTEHGHVPCSPTFCSQKYASTILLAWNEILRAEGWALAHIGVYNPRFARSASGRTFVPHRWSNHAYGNAMDWKGIVTKNGSGELITVTEMRQQCPKHLAEMLSAAKRAIEKVGRRVEIVDEHSWIHVGFYP
jgi:hypothetical protein